MPHRQASSGSAFRTVRPEDAEILADVFSDIDTRFFRPHPFTTRQAQRMASRTGRDVYALLPVAGRPVGYGMYSGPTMGRRDGAAAHRVRAACGAPPLHVAVGRVRSGAVSTGLHGTSGGAT